MQLDDNTIMKTKRRAEIRLHQMLTSCGNALATDHFLKFRLPREAMDAIRTADEKIGTESIVQARDRLIIAMLKWALKTARGCNQHAANLLSINRTTFLGLKRKHLENE